MMFFSKPPGRLATAIPIVLVIGFIAVAGGTEWLSAQLHQQVLAQLKLYYQNLVPMALNLCWAILIVVIARRLFVWLRSGFERFLQAGKETDKGHILFSLTEKGHSFFMLIFQAVYWLVVAFMVLRAVAPDWLQNVVVSSSIVVGVVGFAAQKALGNVVSSLCLHLLPKVSEGDYVTITGSDGKPIVEGKILEIGYLNTRILLKDGRVHTLPNSVLWDNGTIIGEPPPDAPEEPKVMKVILVKDDQTGAGQPAAVEGK